MDRLELRASAGATALLGVGVAAALGLSGCCNLVVLTSAAMLLAVVASLVQAKGRTSPEGAIAAGAGVGRASRNALLPRNPTDSADACCVAEPVLSKAQSCSGTPVCALVAAAHSCDTTRDHSAGDSGVMGTSPQAVLESIALMRRGGHLRYRKAASLCRLHIKIEHCNPEDLLGGGSSFLSAIDQALQEAGSPLHITGASLRRGCVELTLEFLDGGDEVAARNPNGAALDLDLPALALLALGVPPPPADAVGNAKHAVRVQRDHGACWGVRWDPDAQLWRALDQGDSPTAAAATATASYSISGPLAIHAPAQLSGGARGAGRPVRLALLVQGVAGGGAFARDFSAAAASSSASGADDGASPAQQRQPALAVVAKANGRSVAVPVALCSRYDDADAYLLHVDLDVSYLAAGRGDASHGLVVRMELWEGACVVDSTSVAVLKDEAMVAELQRMQRSAVAAGGLDPEDAAYLPAAGRHAEADMLLGDLGSWLDYVVSWRRHAGPGAGAERSGGGGAAGVVMAPPAAAAADADLLDLSSELTRLLACPDLRDVLVGAGRHLLEHFVYHGCVALAACLHDDLRLVAPAATLLKSPAPADTVATMQQQQQQQHSPAAAPGSALAAAHSDGLEQTLSMLHRAVRSGSQDMVSMVLRWLAAEEAPAPSPIDVWGARASYGLTPMHLLAADARYPVDLDVAPSPAAALTAPAQQQQQPSASEALLRWVMGTFPAAVTVWNTYQDCYGNTPAALWATLGGQDIHPQAAAAALEKAVASAGQLELADLWSPVPQRQEAPIHAGATTSAGAGGPTAAVRPHDDDDAQPATPAAASIAMPQTLAQMLRLAVLGFPKDMEKRYVSYVTAASAQSTLIWVVIMVIAHGAAYYKSLSTGDARQALIGGASYVVTMMVAVLLPRVYAVAREPLMLSCLLGRTTCRLLMSTLPSVVHMSDSVIKYIVYGLDVLLDGFLEGTFELIRVPQASAVRLLDLPITAGLIYTHGVRRTYGQALARSAVVCAAGLLMSVLMDIRMRAAFLRVERARSSRKKSE